MPSLDSDEFNRWRRQAEHTAASAERDLHAGDWSWSAFKAQQAAEYGMKALLRGMGEVGPGYSVLKLPEAAGATEPFVAFGRELDRHYIPPCYPDPYPAGSPFEFYDEGATRSALRAARAVLDWVDAEVRRIGD